MPGMDDDEIKKLLVGEIRAARSNDDTELAKKRQDALEYFNGVMNDLKPEVGRSSVVSRDLADTVGWMLPQIVRVFTASENMVEAQPASGVYPVEPREVLQQVIGQLSDEEKAALQAQNPQAIMAVKEKLEAAMESEQERRAQAEADNATATLNYVFWKDNPGYRILRDATWDALVVADAIVKVWHDDTPEYAVTFHSGLSDEDVAQLEADPSVEITHQSTEEVEYPTGDDMAGVPATFAVHEVKVKRLKSKGRRRIECIPPEDYERSDDPPGTERPRYEGQRQYKTRSELVRMGFDRDQVDKLAAAVDDTAEQNARSDGYTPPRNIAHRSMETILLRECYLQADVDDDGIAETIKAYFASSSTGGEMSGELLDWEVWEDEGPFFDIPCDPVPHRWDGKSIADETMDMQRVKTALWRQFNDNIYASNNPQRFVAGKLLNPDELFSPSFGGAIFGEKDAQVTNLAVPFVAGHALEGITFADEVIQRRTGVGRQSMALDPEALQNQSATANQNNKDAAYSQVELVARDMAELGWKPLFRALLKLEIRHQDKPRSIRMGNKAVKIDPRSWNADMDVTINVGLGTGSRDRDLVMLGRVLQTQLMMADRFMAAGATDDAIDMLPKIIGTMVKMAESAGLRNPTSFYPDYTEEKVAKLKALAAEKAQQPDPKTAQAIADQKAKEEQAQREHEYRMAQVQAGAALDQQVAGYEHEQALAKIDRDADLKRYQTDSELQLKRDQLVDELGLKRELGYAELGVDQELGHAGVAADASVKAAASSVHVGGEPG